MQKIQALSLLPPQDPDPPDRIPPASSRLDAPLHILLPPADPQSHAPPRTDGWPTTVLSRSITLCLGLSAAPLDHEFHGLQVLPSLIIVAIADAKETRPMLPQQLHGTPLARFQRSQRAHTPSEADSSRSIEVVTFCATLLELTPNFRHCQALHRASDLMKSAVLKVSPKSVTGRTEGIVAGPEDSARRALPPRSAGGGGWCPEKVPAPTRSRVPLYLDAWLSSNHSFAPSTKPTPAMS